MVFQGRCPSVAKTGQVGSKQTRSGQMMSGSGQDRSNGQFILEMLILDGSDLLEHPFLRVGVNNLLLGRVVRVQTDYYSYEFGLRKLEARV